MVTTLVVLFMNTDVTTITSVFITSAEAAGTHRIILLNDRYRHSDKTFASLLL